MIKQNMIKLSGQQITKNSGPQFVLLPLFCKFCLQVVLDQYLRNTNDICLLCLQFSNSDRTIFILVNL